LQSPADVVVDTVKNGLRFFLDCAGGRATKQGYNIARMLTAMARHWVNKVGAVESGTLREAVRFLASSAPFLPRRPLTSIISIYSYLTNITRICRYSSRPVDRQAVQIKSEEYRACHLFASIFAGGKAPRNGKTSAARSDIQGELRWTDHSFPRGCGCFPRRSGRQACPELSRGRQNAKVRTLNTPTKNPAEACCGGTRLQLLGA
jgi:hypothetical protein